MKNTMKRLALLISLILCCLSASYPRTSLRVLQFNIWQEGTMVKGGFDAIVENIIALNPDVVTFSEVRNYQGVQFIDKLLKALAARGAEYHGRNSVSTGIIAKEEIISQEVVYPLKNDRGSVLKTVVDIGNHEMAFYSAHLDWLNCSSYLPRGYDGCTWKELPSPVTDAKTVGDDNRTSMRDDEIRALMADADKERNHGRMVFIGGDFNEPSLLDWTEKTKNLRDHNGLVIDWDCSRLLLDFGFKDAFREMYPDPVKIPGFTFPANNPDAALKKLCWAPRADDRERIDYIYYLPDGHLRLKSVKVVGPKGFILYGKRTAEAKDEKLIRPKGVWPTDHKALLAIFEIK